MAGIVVLASGVRSGRSRAQGVGTVRGLRAGGTVRGLRAGDTAHQGLQAGGTAQAGGTVGGCHSSQRPLPQL